MPRSRQSRTAVKAHLRQLAWETFERRLTAISSFVDAQLLVRDAPPPNVAGREYYSNLGFFLGQFQVPGGSSRKELELYLGFIRRVDASGQLKPGAGDEVAERLLAAIETAG